VHGYPYRGWHVLGADCGDRLFGESQAALRIGQQPLAGLGQPYAPAAAQEQPYAEVALQPGHPVTDRWLAQVQTSSAPAEAAGRRH
jgi:hypothetical protein